MIEAYKWKNKTILYPKASCHLLEVGIIATLLGTNIISHFKYAENKILFFKIFYSF